MLSARAWPNSSVLLNELLDTQRYVSVLLAIVGLVIPRKAFFPSPLFWLRTYVINSRVMTRRDFRDHLDKGNIAKSGGFSGTRREPRFG